MTLNPFTWLWLRLSRNPVFRAELHHQWYVIEKSRSGRGWIAIAILMLVPALLTSLLLFIGGLFGMTIQGLPITEGDLPTVAIGLGQVMLLVMNIALYVVVLLVSYGLTANSITRERNNHTWENLILTNVSARTVVLGKWSASLWSLYGDHLMIALMRLGLIAWVVAGFPERMINTTPLSTHILVLAAITLSFTLLDVMFTSALALLFTLWNVPGPVSGTVFLIARAGAALYAFWIFADIVSLMYTAQGLAYLMNALIGFTLFAISIILILWGTEQIAVRFSQVSPA
ncbi:MAG: hypothetical protein MUF87_18525 [Anaerolineae bacterium]|jgi:hypothetical protein|nr:hypothetical protein [Anaerolineae bacterium]